MRKRGGESLLRNLLGVRLRYEIKETGFICQITEGTLIDKELLEILAV